MIGTLGCGNAYGIGGGYWYGWNCCRTGKFGGPMTRIGTRVEAMEELPEIALLAIALAAVTAIFLTPGVVAAADDGFSTGNASKSLPPNP